ncbi:MAG: sodium:solute symporter family protein, partial [Catalinimonas sp.]
MTLSTLDLAIIVGFFVLSLVIGLIFTRRAGRDLNSFFLGGRNLPWWVAGTSMVATTFAADTPLAVTELVAQGGVAGNWLWWNALFGGMLTVFFFARLWRRANILTDVEFVELRYAGRAAALLRGFKAIYLGVFMNALIIGWVNVALMTLLEVFFDIPAAEQIWYVAGAMVLVVAYAGLSGLMGVAVTDMIQFAIAIGGCIVLAVLVVGSPEVGGIEGLKAQLPPGTLSFFPKVGTSAGEVATTLTLSVGSFLAYVGVQWWASWYPGAEPGGGGYVAQRMMSTKNERHALLATFFFQIAHYCLRPWPWILVALAALVLYPDLPDADRRFGFVMAMRDFLPSGLRGLLLVAFFAAYMSTISTQLNWGASYAVNDFYRRFVRPDASDKQLVAASRVATGLLMLVALIVTTQIGSIAGVWRFLVEAGAGLGLVLILRWYWWRVNAWSEITASLAPLGGYALAHYAFGWVFPDSFFFTVSFTTVAWLAVTFGTSPTDAGHLDAFYRRVRPEGYWQPVAARSGLPPARA